MRFASNPLSRDLSGVKSALTAILAIPGSLPIVGSVIVALSTLVACSSAKYFQDRVNDVTQVTVNKRYGPPHKVENSMDGGETWTYFERGSGTAGFSGQVRRGGCQAYVLTFDKQAVLRGWQKQSCEG